MDPYGAGVKRSGDNFDSDPKRQKVEGASKVLHVRGLPYYTTEAELAAVVAPFGQVVRSLILHDKNQAFIQMSDVQAASDVVTGLEFSQPTIRSKAIYFQFSSRQEVAVRANQANAPSGGGPTEEGASCTLIVSVSNVTVPVTLDNIHQVCKPYGDVLKIITFNKNMDFQALVQFATMEQATNAKLFLDGKDLFQGCCHLRLANSKRQNLIVKQNDHKSRDFTVGAGANLAPGLMGMGMGGAMDGGMLGMPGMPGGYGFQQQGQAQARAMGGMMSGAGDGGSPVVIVNKLDPEKVTADILFTLLGVYGDVLRVKILYNKRDTAMVQFVNSQQASHAQQNLTGCPLFGQNLMVNKSKHSDVKLPREEDGKELTRDYTGSEQHRFKQKQFVNQKNVNPPSQVLHVANINDATTMQEIVDIFQAQQPTSPPPVVEFFKSKGSMAYVAMNSVDEAVMALINLHNYQLNTYPLRVSFSHKDPNSVTSTPPPQQ